MPSDRMRRIASSPTTRRRFLATAGSVAGVSVTGCSGLFSTPGSGGEGDTVEIIVLNEGDEAVELAVRLGDDDGEALSSPVYELQPGEGDESAGIDVEPASITAFTAAGASATWDYAPDTGLDCAGEDVGITVAGDGDIESWYGC